EVQQELAVDDPERDRRDRPRHRLRQPETIERATCRDVRAGVRRAACPAVGLEDVAVEPERPLPQRLEVGDGADRPADEALDLDRAALLLARRGFALRALAGRARQQRVLRGDPSDATAGHPTGDALLDRGGAEHARLALRIQDGAVRLLQEVGDDLDRPQLVVAPAVGAAHAAALSRSASRTCSTSPIGSCRNRAPVTRKTSVSPVVMNRYVPSRPPSFSIPLRASVSATSRAVSSAEKTRVTPRPSTRWKIGRIRG